MIVYISQAILFKKNPHGLRRCGRRHGRCGHAGRSGSRKDPSDIDTRRLQFAGLDLFFVDQCSSNIDLGFSKNISLKDRWIKLDGQAQALAKSTDGAGTAQIQRDNSPLPLMSSSTLNDEEPTRAP